MSIPAKRQGRKAPSGAEVEIEMLEEQVAAPRVLVIEDSLVIQRLIEVCLRPAGFQVELRADGPSGLEAARGWKPDVVVLDVGLPVMDGWEVLSHLREDPGMDGVKVLVLTAHAQDQTRERAIEEWGQWIPHQAVPTRRIAQRRHRTGTSVAQRTRHAPGRIASA